MRSWNGSFGSTRMALMKASCDGKTASSSYGSPVGQSGLVGPASRRSGAKDDRRDAGPTRPTGGKPAPPAGGTPDSPDHHTRQPHGLVYQGDCWSVVGRPFTTAR